MELPRGTNQTSFERHFPRLLTLLVLPRLGRWGLVDCRYGISPALKLRLQRSPSSHWRHPPSCKRTLTISKSSQSPAVPFTLFVCAAQYSIHLLILSHILSLTFFCRLLSMHYPDVPHSTLGCMGGDSSCFSREHCSVLIHPEGQFHWNSLCNK